MTKKVELIGDVDFNRDDDGEEFGCQRRIIDINNEEGNVTLSFELGRKEDDVMTISFYLTEFLLKVGAILK